jgi:hypothetical protein
MKFTKPLLSALAATLVALPSLSLADSQLSVGVGAAASADLDFRIVIPPFVYFQVGSAGTTVDLVEYDLSIGGVQPGSGAVGSGSFAATGATGGSLSVTLATNAANVSIAASGGNLTAGALTIPFTDIEPSGTGAIPLPDFGTTISPFAPGLAVLTDTWSYGYDNSTIYEAGTYNGTATYTVTAL